MGKKSVKAMGLILGVIAVIVMTTVITMKIGERKTVEAFQQQQQNQREKEIAAQEEIDRLEKEKAEVDADKKLKELDMVLNMARTINQRTKEVYLITSKMDSGELKTIDDIKEEVNRIDNTVRDMINTYNNITPTGTSTTDNMIDILRRITISLDESLIKLNAGINKGDVDGFKTEMSNINEININTEEVINQLSELK